MKGATRRFLDDNGLTITEGKLVGPGPVSLNLQDLQFIGFMLENVTDRSDVWNPVNWDLVEESYKTYWHGLLSRLKSGAPYNTAMFNGPLFCLKDPAQGPVDDRRGVFLIELDRQLVEDLIQHLSENGPDGIIPIQGFKA